MTAKTCGNAGPCAHLGQLFAGCYKMRIGRRAVLGAWRMLLGKIECQRMDVAVGKILRDPLHRIAGASAVLEHGQRVRKIVRVLSGQPWCYGGGGTCAQGAVTGETSSRGGWRTGIAAHRGLRVR